MWATLWIAVLLGFPVFPAPGHSTSRPPLPPIGQVEWQFFTPEIRGCDLPPSNWSVRDANGDLWVRWQHRHQRWNLRRWDARGNPRPVPSELEAMVAQQSTDFIAPPMRLSVDGREWCTAWNSPSGLTCRRADGRTWTLETHYRLRGKEAIVFGDFALDATTVWVASDWPRRWGRPGKPREFPKEVWRLVKLTRPAGTIVGKYFQRPDPSQLCGLYSVVMTEDGTLWVALGEGNVLTRMDARGQVQKVTYASERQCKPGMLFPERLFYVSPWVVVSIDSRVGEAVVYRLQVLDGRTGRQVVRDLVTPWQVAGTGADGTLIVMHCGSEGTHIVGLRLRPERTAPSTDRRTASEPR